MKRHDRAGALDQKQIDAGNRLLAQAVALVNARGRSDDRDGIFELAPWRVTVGYDGACTVQIAYRDVIVMETRWSDPCDAASARHTIKPGSWQSDFLSLRAAHA